MVTLVILASAALTQEVRTGSKEYVNLLISKDIHSFGMLISCLITIKKNSKTTLLSCSIHRLSLSLAFTATIVCVSITLFGWSCACTGSQQRSITRSRCIHATVSEYSSVFGFLINRVKAYPGLVFTCSNTPKTIINTLYQNIWMRRTELCIMLPREHAQGKQRWTLR